MQGMSATVTSSILSIRVTTLCTKGDLGNQQDLPLCGLDYQGRSQKTVLVRVMAPLSE